MNTVSCRTVAAGLLALALALAPSAASAAPEEQPAMLVVVRGAGRPIPVDEALRRASARVPAAWHAALGLTREALQAAPAAPEGDAYLARIALEKLLPEAQRCLPVLLGADGKRRPAFGYASFELTTDGRMGDVKAATEAYPGSAESAACVERVMSAWQLPLPAVGGRAWTHLLGAGPEVAAPASPEAAQVPGATEGWTKPWTVIPGCVGASVRLPPEGRVPLAFQVKFAVLASGEVSGFEVTPPEAPAAAVRAVERAVRGCAWVPAADPAGRLSAVWVVMPLRSEGEAR